MSSRNAGTSHAAKMPLSFIGPVADGDWILNQDYAPTGVRLLQVGDVGEGRFVGKSNRYITRRRADELKCTFLRAGDILISRMPDPIGRACLLPDLGYDAITAVDVSIFRPNPETADSQYLVHYFCSDEWLSNVKGAASGATRARVSRGNLERIKIPLPPLPVQKRIAAMLTEQMAQAQVVRDQIIAASADSRIACDRARLNAILGELDGAPRAKLGDVLLGIEAGRSAQTLERPPKAGERAVLKVSAMSWDRFDPDEAKALPAGFVPPESHFVRKGDLLMSRANTKELVGAAVLVEHDYPDLVLSDKSLRLVTDDTRIFPEYLLAALRLPEARAFIEDKATGSSSSMRNISQALIRQIPLPIPCLATQRSIAEKLSAIAVVRTSLVKALDEQLSAASALPSAYLRRAFAGQP